MEYSDCRFRYNEYLISNLLLDFEDVIDIEYFTYEEFRERESKIE